MSGDQFLREARRLKPDAIRMLFTGYADIQAVISAVNKGAGDTLAITWTWTFLGA